MNISGGFWTIYFKCTQHWPTTRNFSLTPALYIKFNFEAYHGIFVNKTTYVTTSGFRTAYNYDWFTIILRVAYTICDSEMCDSEGAVHNSTRTRFEIT